MKRFTSLMLMLLCAVTTWAQTLVTDAANISSSKVYTLAPSNTSSTGVICVPGTSADKLFMSTHSSATQETNAANINQRFAFLTAGDKTYMYSLGAQKFVADNGTGTALLGNPTEECYVKFHASTGGAKETYPLVVEVGGDYLCISNDSWWADYGYVLTNWNHTDDAGCMMAINEYDPTTEELALIAAANAILANIDYTALNEAIAAANTALTNAGYQLTAGEAVALQIDDVNAAGYLSVSHPACDGDVLAHAIDTDPATLYHSSWVAAAATPYMQVDLGEGVALDAFVLNYSTRQSGNNGAPYAMTVSGSNDGTNFTTITNLSKSDAFFPLPSGNAQSFSSMIAANEAYRYLRFTVTSSPNGNNSFGVSSFGIQKATVEGEKTGLPMRCATIYNALAKAVALNGKANTQSEVNEMAAYLNNIVAHATVVYPFTLTTDINSPVCYLIKAGRAQENWPNPYWTYSENGIVITKYENEEAPAKNVNAYWFFMADDKSGLLRMYPYAEKNSAMGYAAVSDGADKITNAATAVNNVYELVNTTTDGFATYPYALKPYGYNTYVSNHGGDGKRLGFYNGLADGGTRFALVEVATPSAKLSEIAKLIESVAGYEAGTAIGSYSEEGIATLATAVAAATEVLNDATSSDEACQAQIDALNNAVANLAIVLPVEGTFYVIRNAQTQTYAYSKANNKLYHAEGVTNASVWQFVKNDDGSFKLYNVNNGQYLQSLVWTNPSLLGDDACKVEISSCKVAGENFVFIKGHGNGIDGQQMHAQLGGEAPLVFYNEGNGKLSKSSWVIEEFTGTLSHTLTVGAAGYATLMLGYNTTIPTIEGEDCGVFAATIDGEWAVMNEINGVLPANTAVIVKATPGDYPFTYTTETATVENNDLRGTLYDKYITEDAYVLGKDENNVAYLGKVVYNVSTDTTNDGTEEAPEVTYEAWKNNAFKAYLPAPTNSQGVKSYSLRFEGEGTTGIENVEVENEVKAIYDLTGRRVEAITAPGIYIVNGKKVLVK